MHLEHNSWQSHVILFYNLLLTVLQAQPFHMVFIFMVFGVLFFCNFMSSALSRLLRRWNALCKCHVLFYFDVVHVRMYKKCCFCPLRVCWSSLCVYFLPSLCLTRSCTGSQSTSMSSVSFTLVLNNKPKPFSISIYLLSASIYSLKISQEIIETNITNKHSLRAFTQSFCIYSNPGAQCVSVLLSYTKHVFLLLIKWQENVSIQSFLSS